VAGAAILVERTLAEHGAMRALITDDRPDNWGQLFEVAQRLLLPPAE